MNFLGLDEFSYVDYLKEQIRTLVHQRAEAGVQLRGSSVEVEADAEAEVGVDASPEPAADLEKGEKPQPEKAKRKTPEERSKERCQQLVDNAWERLFAGLNCKFGAQPGGVEPAAVAGEGSGMGRDQPQTRRKQYSAVECIHFEDTLHSCNGVPFALRELL